MKKKAINVLIPDCNSGHTMAVVRCLGKMSDVALHGCTDDGKIPFRYSRYTKSFSLITQSSDEDYIKKLNAIIKDKNIDVILPIGGGTYRFFAANIASIDSQARLATTASAEILEMVSNKYELAKFCDLHKIPSPKTAYLDAYKKETNGLDLPLIVKPETGWGGNNVYHIVTEADFSTVKPTKHASEGKYIVQEYIDGYDIDMSLLADKGKIVAYTIQKGFLKRSNPFAASAGLEFLENDGVYQTVEKLIKELEYSGIAHLDLRYDKHSGIYKIVEINTRYWGSLIASYLAGVNFPYLHILSTLEEEIPSSSYTSIEYMDFLAALKSTKNSLFSRQDLGFRWKDTDYLFYISDPVAEIYNAWKRSGN